MTEKKKVTKKKAVKKKASKTTNYKILKEKEANLLAECLENSGCNTFETAETVDLIDRLLLVQKYGDVKKVGKMVDDFFGKTKKKKKS